jgi:hypothetical protein
MTIARGGRGLRPFDMIYFTSHSCFKTKGAWAVKLGSLGNRNDKHNWQVSVLSWPGKMEFSSEPPRNAAQEQTVTMRISSQRMFNPKGLEDVRSLLEDMIDETTLEALLQAAGCPSEAQESVKKNLIDRMVVMITEMKSRGGAGYVWDPVQGLY